MVPICVEWETAQRIMAESVQQAAANPSAAAAPRGPAPGAGAEPSAAPRGPAPGAAAEPPSGGARRLLAARSNDLKV